jgi:hypothetical protein
MREITNKTIQLDITAYELALLIVGIQSGQLDVTVKLYQQFQRHTREITNYYSSDF